MTADGSFQELLESRRHRTSEWFHNEPPTVLDVCQVPLTTRIESE